jgi:hypothetical protein
VKLNEKEERLLKLLGQKTRTTTQLAELFYREEPTGPPFNANQIILGRMNTIRRKLHAMRDPRMLKKSDRRGPHPIFWSIQRRPL